MGALGRVVVIFARSRVIGGCRRVTGCQWAGHNFKIGFEYKIVFNGKTCVRPSHMR